MELHLESQTRSLRGLFLDTHKNQYSLFIWPSYRNNTWKGAWSQYWVLMQQAWNTLVQILLSVISILNEPNINSPANVDASILYKKYREASDKKKSQTVYAKIILEQVSVWLSVQQWGCLSNDPLHNTTYTTQHCFKVRKSRKIAEEEGIKVPTKVEDYVIRPPKLSSSLHQSFGSSVDVEENDNNLVSETLHQSLCCLSIRITVDVP